MVPLAGGIACLGLVAASGFRAAAATFALTAVTFVGLLFSVGTDRIDRHQANHRLFRAIYARSKDPQIASYKVLEPSWVFYGGRPIREFKASGVPGDRTPALEAARLLAMNADAFIITTVNKIQELTSILPPGTGVIETVPYFLKGNQQLVVIGRLNARSAGADEVTARATNGKHLR
jgi:hypothetical protein